MQKLYSLQPRITMSKYKVKTQKLKQITIKGSNQERHEEIKWENTQPGTYHEAKRRDTGGDRLRWVTQDDLTVWHIQA